MNNPIQISLFPDLVPHTETETIKPVKTGKPVKAEKIQKLSQGDLVETPSGKFGIVMLVNPLGDCWVEVKGQPRVYLPSDLKKLNVAVVSPEITLHQLYLERHAYKVALDQAAEDDIPGLQEAWELREKFLNAVHKGEGESSTRNVLPQREET